MIANESDGSGVDYDIFSLAGRAALLGGGLYAIDKSMKEGHFKPGKGNLLNKKKNPVVHSLADTLMADPGVRKEEKLPAYQFKDTDLFAYSDAELLDAKKKRFRTIHHVADPFEVNGNKDVRLRDMLKGGYKGQSADLLAELEDLQSEILKHDFAREFSDMRKGNGSPGQMDLSFNKQGQLTTISMPSKAGRIKVHVVDERGFVTMGSSGQNQYVSRGMHMAAENGFGKGMTYGSDVAYVRAIKKNYLDIVRGKITLDEFNDRYRRSLQFDDKTTGFTSVSRMNPASVDLIRNSSMADPISGVGRKSIQAMMKNAAEAGFTTGSASDVAKGILYLAGNVIEKIPFLKETNNAKQLIRSNVSYLDANGKHKTISNEEVLFMEKHDLDNLREIMAQDGIHFGELAKEETLINKATAGTLIDNTRSIQLHSGKLSDLNDFLLKQMANTAGMSLKEFTTKLKEGGGFQAFGKETHQKLKKIGFDDYRRYLKKQIKESKAKRSAYLKVNKNTAHTGGTINDNVFYREADRFKQDGILDQKIQDIDAEIVNRMEQLRNSNILGVSTDGQDIVKLEGLHRGTYLDDISVTESGAMTLAVRREKQLGQGDKLHDPSGEIKATVKKRIDNMHYYLEKLYRSKLGNKKADPEILKRIRKTTIIANAEAVKSGLDPRNLFSMFDSIKKETAHRMRNFSALDAGEQSRWSAINSTIKNFDKNFATAADEDKVKFFKNISDIVGGESNFKNIAGLETDIGYFKGKMAAFGNAAIDMGAGGLGFFSERHMKLFNDLGLKSFAKEVMSRRTDPGAVQRYRSIENAEAMMRDGTNVKTVKTNTLGGDFMENVFPTDLPDDGIINEKVIAKRAEYLKNSLIDGVAYVDLDDEILGYKKIAIFADPNLRGHIGEKVANVGKYKKYTELDSVTRKIIEEVKKPKAERNAERLRTLMENYDEAMTQMKDSLRDKILKGKVTHSLNAQVSSGTDELKDYARRLAASRGTKAAQPFVVAVNKKKFIEMYGPEAYDSFDKNTFSKFWATAVREPVEGISAVAVNVVPSDHFKGIDDLDDTRMALVNGEDNNILKMVYGDYDGDQMSLIAAKTEAGAAELSELSFGNNAFSIEYRKAQELKTKFSLKGNAAESILEHGLAQLRLSTYYAKDLEKGFIGVASNRLSPLHDVNSLINQADPEKFFRVKNTLHLFSENIIKGKKQKYADLISGRAKDILNAITANESFAAMESSERIKTFRSFADELLVGGSDIADKIRSGEDNEDIRKIFATPNGITREDFLALTNDQAMEDIMEVSMLSKRPDHLAQDTIEASLDRIKNASKNEQGRLVDLIADNMEDMKMMRANVGGNLMKFAILPAAALGLMGTVFGARSSIEASVEFSDGSYTHKSSGGDGGRVSPFKAFGTDNMRSPKHMKPSISGNARSGFDIGQYTAKHRAANLRIQDDTRNFDYYDMQDKINKGF